MTAFEALHLLKTEDIPVDNQVKILLSDLQMYRRAMEDILTLSDDEAARERLLLPIHGSFVYLEQELYRHLKVTPVSNTATVDYAALGAYVDYELASYTQSESIARHAAQWALQNGLVTRMDEVNTPLGRYYRLLALHPGQETQTTRSGTVYQNYDVVDTMIRSVPNIARALTRYQHSQGVNP